MTPTQLQLQTLCAHAGTIVHHQGYPPASPLDCLRRALIHSGELLTAVLTNDQHFVMASLEEIALWLLSSLSPGARLLLDIPYRHPTDADVIVSAVAMAHRRCIRYPGAAFLDAHVADAHVADALVADALALIAAYPGFDLPAALAHKAACAQRMSGLLTVQGA
jgi:hypothetical protein